jgi:hypothetical protein
MNHRAHREHREKTAVIHSATSVHSVVKGFKQ